MPVPGLPEGEGEGGRATRKGKEIKLALLRFPAVNIRLGCGTFLQRVLHPHLLGVHNRDAFLDRPGSFT